MKVKYQSLNPSDARIHIDFHNRKNPVSFDYVNKKSAFSISYTTFLGIWLPIAIILIAVAVMGVVIAVIVQPVGIETETTELSTSDIDNIFLGLGLIIGGVVFSILGMPLIPAYIFSKNETLLKYMPKINAWSFWALSRFTCDYIKVRKLDSKVFEVPVFQNVYVEYKLTGEFKKYVHELKIEEHNFWTRQYSLITHRVKKQSKQTEYWKMLFMFDKIPKTGYLEVKFS